MDLGLTGKRALVLGAGRGLGKAIAQSLASEGVVVFAADRSVEKMQAWAAEMDAVHPSKLDLEDISNVDAVVDKLLADGGADIVLNNSGLSVVA